MATCDNATYDVMDTALACPAEGYMAALLREVCGRYHLAYLKLDLTTMFNAYGEPPAIPRPTASARPAAPALQSMPPPSR
jgi:hypothetical protein